MYAVSMLQQQQLGYSIDQLCKLLRTNKESPASSVEEEEEATDSIEIYSEYLLSCSIFEGLGTVFEPDHSGHGLVSVRQLINRKALRQLCNSLEHKFLKGRNRSNTDQSQFKDI